MAEWDYGDCPAFPADPTPNRWVPIHLEAGVDMGYRSSRDGHRVIVVLEVCPSYKGWRDTFYHESACVPRIDSGVQSTS